MTPNFKLSILLPCLNEQDNILAIYNKLLEQVPANTEFIFIDDGSTDDTLVQIKSLAANSEAVKYISFSRNFGHQNALKAGLDYATGDCIISMDADLQHPPELLAQMIEKWQEGYDIVQTVRIDSKSTGLFKRVFSKLFYRFINKISDTYIVAGTADFRLISRKVADALKCFPEFHLFYRGLIPYIGFKQYMLEFTPNSRHSGSTKYTFKRMLKFAFTGITSFSTKPLKIAIYLGLLLTTLSIIYACYVLVIYFFTPYAVSGWASVIVTLVFLGGIQISLLGIIGEYLGKLFVENKHRPKYIINDTNIT